MHVVLELVLQRKLVLFVESIFKLVLNKLKGMKTWAPALHKLFALLFCQVDDT
jgi:hypothetical protein